VDVDVDVIVNVNDRSMKFTHENLDVYGVATRFLALSSEMAKAFPRGNADLADQFKRAALSITLNIAEGAGKPSRRDSSRFFAIARGSALECAAILDACLILKLVPAPKVQCGKELLIRVVSMLTGLCR